MHLKFEFNVLKYEHVVTHFTFPHLAQVPLVCALKHVKYRVCVATWVRPLMCLRLLSPAISRGTDSRRELTLRQEGASWMTALLCCRILSTSQSGVTRGTLPSACWMEGVGVLLLVMQGGILLPYGHASAPQWDEAEMVHGLSSCEGFEFWTSFIFCSTLIFFLLYLLTCAAKSFVKLLLYLKASCGCFMGGQGPDRDTSQCGWLTVIHSQASLMNSDMSSRGCSLMETGLKWSAQRSDLLSAVFPPFTHYLIWLTDVSLM